MADVQLRDVGEALDQTLFALDVRYFNTPNDLKDFSASYEFAGKALLLASKDLLFAVRDAAVATCEVKKSGKVKIVMDEYSITINPHGGVMRGGRS